MTGKHSNDYDEYKVRAPKTNEYGNSSRTTSTGTKKTTSSKKKRRKKNKALRVIGIILLIILLLIIGVVAAGYGFLSDKFGKMKTVNIDEGKLEVSENQNLTGYRNIALFGIDSRADDYGVGNRSDCIIIASINNETKEVKLISVYRDTYVQIEGHGLDKITHAYSYGGAELAIKTLNMNLDLNITEFVTVNFDSVSDAVDELGGIQMNITAEETQYINGYIDEVSKVTGKKSSHITTAGTQTLDGVQAVAYCRIRYTAGGDYKRTERMRDVIEAMVQKLKTKNLGELNSFADKMLQEVYTNITMGDILSLLPSLASFKIDESMGWPYNVKGYESDRWYGVPVTLESNVIKLHEEVFKDENYKLPSRIQTISNKIITKTGYSE